MKEHVVVFMERVPGNIEFLKMFKEKYLQMKGTDDEFELIHVLVLESSDSV